MPCSVFTSSPGGAFPFLGGALGELHNTGVSLVELWGEKRARRLVELLHEAGTVERKFQILERWLMWIADRSLITTPPYLSHLRTFQSDPGLFTSEEVARQVNLSQRRFIELFRDEVGLTPKLFCRVQRFQNVINSIEHKAEAEVDWVDLALSHGYSDQSHFIHDFRAFSGLSPTEYLPLRTELPQPREGSEVVNFLQYGSRPRPFKMLTIAKTDAGRNRSGIRSRGEPIREKEEGNIAFGNTEVRTLSALQRCWQSIGLAEKGIWIHRAWGPIRRAGRNNTACSDGDPARAEKSS